MHLYRVYYLDMLSLVYRKEPRHLRSRHGVSYDDQFFARCEPKQPEVKFSSGQCAELIRYNGVHSLSLCNTYFILLCRENAIFTIVGCSYNHRLFSVEHHFSSLVLFMYFCHIDILFHALYKGRKISSVI